MVQAFSELPNINKKQAPTITTEATGKLSATKISTTGSKTCVRVESVCAPIHSFAVTGTAATGAEAGTTFVAANAVIVKPSVPTAPQVTTGRTAVVANFVAFFNLFFLRSLSFTLYSPAINSLNDITCVF